MRILLTAIYPYVFLLLYIIIPFDNYIRALPNILLGILLVAFPLVVKKEDFKKLNKPPIFLFLLFFTFLVLNAVFSGRMEGDIGVIKKVLIAVGLVILYIPVHDFKKINRAIIFSSLAAIIFTIAHFVVITHETGNFELGDSPQVIESLLVDRLYLGLLSILSIMLSFQSIKKTFHPDNGYYVANILINLVFIVAIGSKIALIALLILLLLKQFYGNNKRRQLLITGGILIVFAGVFFLLKGNTSQPVNLKEAEEDEIGFIENPTNWELRSVILKCTQYIALEEGFTLAGIGFKTTEERLVSCYGSLLKNSENREVLISKKYNTHNQFLDFYLSAGLIGVLLFVIFLGQVFFQNRKNYFPTAFLFTLVMYFLVENVFHRQIGAYYIGFILILLLSSGNLIKVNGIKQD